MADSRTARNWRPLLCVFLIFGTGPTGFGQTGVDAPDSGSAFDNQTYEVDTDASQVFVRVNKSTRFGHSHGVQGKLLSGWIVLDTSSPEGELVFDLRRFQVDTPEARKVVGLSGDISASDRQKTRETMMGPEVLDTRRYPTAKFVVKSISASDAANGTLRISGDFTLHGVERPVDIAATTKQSGDNLKLIGFFKLKQSDYDITPYRALGGLVGISDELQIRGDLELAPRERAEQANP